jgi:hypothetical protein
MIVSYYTITTRPSQSSIGEALHWRKWRGNPQEDLDRCRDKSKTRSYPLARPDSHDVERADVGVNRMNITKMSHSGKVQFP